MDNYDPNTKWAEQTVKLTFQQWQYKVEFIKQVGGNCTGLSVIESALSQTYDDLPEEDGVPSMTLTDAQGNTLQCDDDEDDGVTFLENMLVSAEIVAIEPKA